MPLPASTTRTVQAIAQAIAARPEQVVATIALLDEGATVPFIARYRKEVTGGLDDIQLRALATRLEALRALEERRAAVEKSLRALGVWTPVLGQALDGAQTRAEVEAIHAPFKVKKTGKAQRAREGGLQPLADALRKGAPDPVAAAKAIATKAKIDPEVALAGARDILVEEVASDAVLVAALRAETADKGALVVRVPRGGDTEAAKPFADVLSRPQKLASLPSHRLLGVLRAVKAGVLAVEAVPDASTDPEARVRKALGLARPARTTGEVWVEETAQVAWKDRLKPAVSGAVVSVAREKAEEDAAGVFARNLSALLLAAPAGPKVVMGIDPGVRTGIKVAVIDATGKILATHTFYPFAPKNDKAGTQVGLAGLVRRHKVDLIAIGSGTGGRETQAVVRSVLAALPKGQGPVPQAFLVSEAGASVYSASEVASKELPHLDVSLRGAVSIARRVQDPLAELIKIDPTALGIGQYQHDIDAGLLTKALAGVVQDAVAAVGVDVNSASVQLLTHVPGVGPALAEAIVAHRDANGPFATRKALRKVARMGPKAFEQCAGFLRIRGGKEPLDATGIHPESYDVAKAILAAVGGKPEAVLGKPETLKGIKPQAFVREGVGLATVKSVLEELARPGRDPRAAFQVAQLDETVQSMEDLRVGMKLQGTVTNVAAFGAFVDIGVHQDGLVHISQLADKRVSDPHEVVKVGDTVDVTVVSVEVERKRIGLSMRKA
jgi:protein Tex